MRRLTWTGGLALGASLLIVATSAAGATGGECAPAGAHVVAVDTQAAVYVVDEPYFVEGTHTKLGTIATYRGCANGAHRSYELGIVGVGSATGGVGIGKITLGGFFAAFEFSRVVKGSESVTRVVVRDLRNGRVIAVPTGTPHHPPEPHYVGIGQVRALVVKSDGAVAWIAEDKRYSEELEVTAGHEVEYDEVYALEKGGERLLAAGPEVAGNSLALGGSSIYWIEAGKPAVAQLR